MRTRDKIIQASIELFNERGERNITTNHIAEHLAISPGNLYYHFRNKEDIIRNIFELYKNQLENAFTPAQFRDDAMALFRHSLDQVFELMWRFNFFYANLPDILARDDQLQLAYNEVQNAQIGRMQKAVEVLKYKGILQIDQEDIPEFVNAIKVTVIFWISYSKTINPAAQIEKGTIYRGILTVLSMLKPYLNKQDKARIKALQRHYGELSEQLQSAD